ncbi:unnamed protein product [Ixodes persulcatus]
MAGDAEEIWNRRRLFHVQDLPVRCEGSGECFALDVDRQKEACYGCNLRSDGDDWNDGSTDAESTGVDDAAHDRGRGDGQLEVACSQVLYRKQFGSADNARGRVEDGIHRRARRAGNIQGQSLRRLRGGRWVHDAPEATPARDDRSGVVDEKNVGPRADRI